MATRVAKPGVDVVVEVGTRRIFASALQWPGWSRSAKAAGGEADALASLADYASRYAPVARRAGLSREFAAVARPFAWRVVDRTAGDATTDFGAPSRASDVEGEPALGDEARRLVDLLEAAWDALDDVAARAPEQLRKGPRGGGRDRDAVVAHVVNAEVAYARKVGLRRVSKPPPGDVAAVEELRSLIRGTLAGTLPKGAASSVGAWAPRYAVRRMAWHVLDHVWEIEDRSDEATRRTRHP